MPAQWVETREVPVAELTRFPGNARRGNVPVIRQSLLANGQYRAIVVRKCDDGQLVILAGNHTYDAMRDLIAKPPSLTSLLAAVPEDERERYQESAEALLDQVDRAVIRCDIIRCTDRESRKINLADNRTSDLAVDDSDALVELLSYLDGDYEGTGWTEEDVTHLIEPPDFDHKDEDGEGGDSGGDPGEPGRGDLLQLAGVTIGEPRHKVEEGQVWKLGPHHLVIADLFADWALWSPLLEGDALFMPYPTPLVPHAPDIAPLVMVQPIAYLAGHLLDKWQNITGQEPVVVNG